MDTLLQDLFASKKQKTTALTFLGAEKPGTLTERDPRSNKYSYCEIRSWQEGDQGRPRG